MQEHIDNRMYHIEVFSPRQNVPDLDDALGKLAAKYGQILDAGHVVCFTDNPLGKLAFQGTELIQELGLPVRPGQVSIHVTTFHTKENLDQILTVAAELGINNILAVSGDGSERLPKLRGPDVGFEVESVTSVELVAYIQREFPGAFHVGVAFNPYEPPQHEFEKLHRKVDAGAQFIVTQPILGAHEAMAKLPALGLPIIVEAWMSKRLYLLSDCIGYEIPQDTLYEPMDNLRQLVQTYRGCGFYLSMLGFKTQLPLISQIWH